MSLGKKLKDIRKQHHLSQRDMSERLLMDQSTYSRYENDKSTLTLDIINRIVTEFNVSLDHLLQSESKTIVIDPKTLTYNNLVQMDNYYAVPKSVMEIMLQQQQNITLLLLQIAEKNI
ncbi:helix-turn-helix domain-containing protein [Ferruginibacter sp. SUN106]|uniref:helix-turn-helix domain-containing protein n=1 Tax=Ferruginibacter sp. SUN106 TaxID=2978348 RepID=UPI003D368488